MTTSTPKTRNRLSAEAKKRLSMKAKRISFDQYDAAELYEWKLAFSQCLGNDAFPCHNCDKIEARLQQFIGEKEARRLRQQIKKHPYCIK